MLRQSKKTLRKSVALRALALLVAAPWVAQAGAQRLQQPLERSVVAVANGNTVGVSWRKLAQDPAGTTYNLYRRTSGGGEFAKVNATPLAVTNYQTTLAALPYGTELAVTTVSNGKESERSLPFLFTQKAWNNLFFDFNFETKLLNPNDYRCKFAWPMDLDGDGKVDAILADRLYAGSGDGTHKLQAYLLDGTCLWTVDIGPNINICSGQSDMVTVYDINCDGKCEVIVKSSDGTRFWNADENTWGRYANGSETADTDGDGIVDYRKSATRNAPYYVSVVDGRTGAELDCSELKYSELTDGEDQYSRDNRADYMSDDGGREYAFLSSKFVIAYFDGIHPSLGVEACNRTTDRTHHYYMFAWSYDWTGGKASNWHHSYSWSRNDKRPNAAEFHQLRVADTDGDGIDEVLEGGFGVNPTKGMVYSAGIGHGDRFDVTDIDPDRPGMEVFAIQQSDLLGQVLYDAATGEHIKEWYLPTIFDVGRGRCMDVDPDVKGCEIFSTLPNLYDCKGNVIKEGATTYPQEAIWWDGDLQRELIGTPGGSGYSSNVMVQKYDGTRLVQFSRESDWAVHSGWANRPAFVGDITGDWREEIVLMKQNENSSTGLVGYSTHLSTPYAMYTLQEDPHYRLDCTGRGYYQSPCTSFYLGGDMPQPPLPPVMTAQLRWHEGAAWAAGQGGFTDFEQKTGTSYADGQTVMFDISGSNAQPIALEGELRPGTVWLMAPRGHDYTFGGTGTLAGSMEMWKSMQGTATFNTSLAHTGMTTVSEGTLCVNGRMAGPVTLGARGTLSGTVTLGDTIVFEGALNYEGCRLLVPGTEGRIVSERSLTLPGSVFVEVSAAGGHCGRLVVKGDLTLKGSNTFTVKADSLAEGDYVLAECDGKLTADVSQIATRGLDGLNYDLVAEGHRLVLRVHGSRAAAENVVWTGSQNAVWDYKQSNFALDGQPTPFVAGDKVVFGDGAAQRDITVNEMVQTAGITFDVNQGTYTFSGKGGFSGSGPLVKNGQGEVVLELPASDYTGATTVNAGTLTVTGLDDGGKASCLGAAPAAPGGLLLQGGTLKVVADNVATDRVVSLSDTSAIAVANASSSLSLKGQVRGDGILVKSGPGQLNFNHGGTNPFGGMIVRQGVVSQGAWNATFGRAGSPLVLDGGEVLLIKMNDSSRRPVLNQAVSVPEGSEGTIRGTTRGAINGSVSGGGRLTIVSDGVRNDIGASFGNFTGTLVAEGANFRLMDNVTDLSKATLELAEGSVVGHYASNSGGTRAITTKVGALSTKATDCTLGNGVDTYTVGHNGVSTTYSGLLKAATVTKVGQGVLTLRTAGSTSAIKVDGGELRLSNIGGGSNPTPLTTGLVTVNSGGMLSGMGCAASVLVNKGGVLSAGAAGVPGTLKATGKLTLAAGSTLMVQLAGSSTVNNSKYRINGNITHSGDTILVSVPGEVTLKAGDELQIFTGTGSQTGSYILKTASPDRTIEWDDSALLTSGVLRVREVTTGIGHILAEQGEVNVYSTGGQLLRSGVAADRALDGLPAGVYVVNGKKVVAGE